MTLNLPDDVLALLMRELCAQPALKEFLKAEIARHAEELRDQDDLISPEQAAAMIGVTPATLRAHQREWGLDKSVAFGLNKPRYFRSQIIARAKEQVIKGRNLSGKQERRKGFEVMEGVSAA